jgi:hypothetical protein
VTTRAVPETVAESVCEPPGAAVRIHAAGGASPLAVFAVGSGVGAMHDVVGAVSAGEAVGDAVVAPVVVPEPVEVPEPQALVDAIVVAPWSPGPVALVVSVVACDCVLCVRVGVVETATVSEEIVPEAPVDAVTVESAVVAVVEAIVELTVPVSVLPTTTVVSGGGSCTLGDPEAFVVVGAGAIVAGGGVDWVVVVGSSAAANQR